MCSAALLLGGCTSGSSDAEDPEATESSTSATDEESPDDETSQEAEDENYLDVPEGVVLTDQGSELGIGDVASVAWRPRQSLIGALDVEVVKVEKTTFKKSFENWKIDKQTGKKTPYFIRAWIENVGDTELGGTTVPLYIVDSENTLVQPSRFQAEFKPCPSSPVFEKDFKPGKRVKYCLVYLAPENTTLEAVSFRPTQEFDPITWTGSIKDIAGGDSPKNSNNKKNGSKNNGGGGNNDGGNNDGSNSGGGDSDESENSITPGVPG